MSENEPTTEEAPAPASDGALAEDEKTMALLVHLLGGFTGFVGPLIIWLIKKDSSAFVNQEGKTSLNWQITLMIAWVCAIIIMVAGIVLGSMIAAIIGTLFGCVAYIAILALCVCNLVLCIMGGLKAKEGTAYTYPFSLKLLS